ncbi:hypothetical protein [Psychromicrobium sp. YIM B11713]
MNFPRSKGCSQGAKPIE